MASTNHSPQQHGPGGANNSAGAAPEFVMPFVWTGEAMVPPASFARRADQTFVIGQRYVLTEVQERSAVSHRHFFACVREAWSNLRGADVLRFPNPETLRKHALIKAGYCDVQQFVCEFKTEARRLAAALSTDHTFDDYVIIDVREKVVTRYRAKSQSVPAMKGPEFQASKEAVLSILADMIGVEPAALAGARAA